MVGGLLADLVGWKAPFYGAALLSAAAVVGASRLRDPGAEEARAASWRQIAHALTRPRLLTVSATTALITFTIYVTTYGFVPVFATALGGSQTEVGLLAMLAQGGFTVGALISGFATRRLAPSHLIALGAVLVACSSAFVPFVSSLLWLDALQLCGGVGRGLVNPVAAALVIRSATEAERTTSMGVYQAIWSLGIVLGPPLAGWIAEGHGLTAAFSAGAGASLAGAVIAICLARRPA